MADEVEQRVSQFAHQPAVKVRDSIEGIIPGATVDDGVPGAVYQGAIYRFRDRLGSRIDVQRTLFHELFHHGLRRFLTEGQYAAGMRELYDRNAHIRRHADAWLKFPPRERDRPMTGAWGWTTAHCRPFS